MKQLSDFRRLCGWLVAVTAAWTLVVPAPISAQSPPPPATSASTTDADYVLGPGDQLSVVVWREAELSQEVVVRPDGKISLPLINDVVAAGLTPEQLRIRLTGLARKFVLDPVVTVVVKEINSRVFITGQVLRPGPYVLTGPMTVLQLIALAGGFTDFAHKGKILIARLEAGVQYSFPFNYDDTVRKGSLAQNIVLKPGDTVVVP